MLEVKDAFRQGAQSYDPAITVFEDMMAAGTLKHSNSPVTNACVNLCQVHQLSMTTKSPKTPVKDSKGSPNDAALAILMTIAKRDDLGLEEEVVSDDFLSRMSGGGAVAPVSDELAGLLS